VLLDVLSEVYLVPNIVSYYGVALLQFFDNEVLGATDFKDVGVDLPGLLLSQWALADDHSDLGRFLLLCFHFMKIIIKVSGCPAVMSLSVKI
jgi:hypothetical protein